ncbi:hypothetical protein COU54_04090 [Candidatus Pacearchaeota archaeon CG10_big_fil_rev_8_21_14_0_10_31_24]|nr:MAG: hypothetical protein COU54_04090 [Candidatus Pacearchaeota archaeon CG10_big_fil_rev_8_21_14_0_10_31_24]
MSIESKITELSKKSKLSEIKFLYENSDQSTRLRIIYNVPEERLMDSDSVDFYIMELKRDYLWRAKGLPFRAMFGAVSKTSNIKDMAKMIQLITWKFIDERGRYQSIDEKIFNSFIDAQSDRITSLLNGLKPEDVLRSLICFTDCTHGSCPSFPDKVTKKAADLIKRNFRTNPSYEIIKEMRKREILPYNDRLEEIREHFEKIIVNKNPTNFQLARYLSNGATRGPITDELLKRYPEFWQRTKLYKMVIRQFDSERFERNYHTNYCKSFDSDHSLAYSIISNSLAQTASNFEQYKFCFKNKLPSKLKASDNYVLLSHQIGRGDYIGWLDLCADSANNIKELNWAIKQKKLLLEGKI